MPSIWLGVERLLIARHGVGFQNLVCAEDNLKRRSWAKNQYPGSSFPDDFVQQLP